MMNRRYNLSPKITSGFIFNRSLVAFWAVFLLCFQLLNFAVLPLHMVVEHSAFSENEISPVPLTRSENSDYHPGTYDRQYPSDEVDHCHYSVASHFCAHVTYDVPETVAAVMADSQALFSSSRAAVVATSLLQLAPKHSPPVV